MAVGLFRTLAAIVLAWYVFRYLNRWASRQDQRRSSGTSGTNGRSKPSESTKPSEPSDADLGEYVDYEELDKD